MNTARLVIGLSLCLLARSVAADSVSLTIATQKGVAVTAQQEWARRLAKAQIPNVRLRSAVYGDQPDIEAIDTGRGISYRVTGVLDRRGGLQLPGASFTSADLTKLRDYLDRVKADGKQAVAADRGRFDLTKDQFEKLFQSLGGRLAFDTKGKSVLSVVERAATEAGLKLALEPRLRPTLARIKCRDDLRTLSLGCGIAIALKAEGMVIAPEKPRGAPVRLAVTYAKDAKDSWPIGWPTKARTSELSPMLMERINVEIDGFTLTEAVDAIAPRLKMPFLWDHAALAKRRIDPDKAQVKLPPARMTYKRILDKLLFQAHLHGGVRVDEAGTVFYWVTR